MTTTTRPAPSFRFDAVSLGFVACFVAAAAMVGWMSIAINRERTCALGESPGVDLCPRVSPGSVAEIEMLGARIAHDPGDANAYTALALADTSPRHDALVEIASRLAPREPNLLLHRAAAAFQRQDWAAAAGPLVELVDTRESPAAAKALAWLVASERGALLEPYLRPGSQWLPRVLAAMRDVGAPFSSALPLVVHALQRGALEPQAVRGYMSQLKAQGAWADAYGLWLSLHGKQLPALFNGGFDRAFEADGFDWELPDAAAPRRAGVIVERRRIEGRGGVLELQFTGRAIALPIVRQHLFLGPGRYVLRGEFMGRRMRAEDALRWNVRCRGGSAGMTEPLSNTDGLWRKFEFTFVLRADCGLVAALELQTASGTDAALGGRGRAAFDAFTLERTGP
jgi:hypothetical protein